MLLNKFEDRESWLEARRGKITGSKLKDIIVKRGTGKKKGYYQLIVDKIAVLPDGENPMERGTRLEDEALDRFIKETGKEVDKSLVIFSREDNPNIAFSPDGFIGDNEVVEVKCLNSASHIEAWLTQEVPDEYYEQTIQPFIVNDTLTTLYLVFYDPRILYKDYFYLTINRKDIQEKVDEYLDYQRKTLAEIDEIVLKLTNF